MPTQERKSGDIPIYGSNGIVGYNDTSDLDEEGVVTGRSGSIGQVYFIKGRYWPLNTTLYVKDFRNNDKKFTALFLSNFNLSRFATGTGVPTLNRNDVHREQIAFPQVMEQRRIVEITEAIDTQLDGARNRLEASKKLRKAVMQDLLTGKVRVKVN